MTKLEVFNLVLECRDSAAERKGVFRRASHEVLTWLEEARNLRAFYPHRLYNLVLGMENLGSDAGEYLCEF